MYSNAFVSAAAPVSGTGDLGIRCGLQYRIMIAAGYTTLSNSASGFLNPVGRG